MASWAAFEAAAPAMAEAGRRLLYQFGPGLGFLATIRADGGPRLHPICPVVAVGELVAFIVRASPKYADLLRDGRYALHAFPPETTDDEFLVMGSARPLPPGATATAALAEYERMLGHRPGENEGGFILEIERAMLATYTARGVFPPRYDRWVAE